MAKIKTIKRTVLGDEVSFDIKVDSSGRFSTSHPRAIMERCKDWGGEFSTIDGVITEIDRVVTEINDQNTEIEHFIAYNFEARNTPDRWCENEHSFKLIWTIYQKTTIGNSVTYNYVDYDTFSSHKDRDPLPVPDYYVLGNVWTGWRGRINGESANPETDETLPFTPENLAFFLHIGQQLKALNDKIETFLEPKNVMKFIATNLPPMLVAANEKKRK